MGEPLRNPEQDGQSRWIDEFAGHHFDEFFTGSEHRKWLYAEFAQPTIDFYQIACDRLALNPGETFLELGCGNGEFAFKVREHYTSAGKVVATDPQPDRYAEAQIILQNSGRTDMEFLKADARDLPFDDNSFDTGQSNYVKNHVVDPEKAIKQWSRVTVPGGRVGMLLRGSQNMAISWEKSAEITEDLGFKAMVPAIPYKNFDANVIQERVSPFRIIEELSYPTKGTKRRIMPIKAYGWPHYRAQYIDNIASTVLSQIPETELSAELREAIEHEVDQQVGKVFHHIVTKNGAFVETVEERYFYMINDK